MRETILVLSLIFISLSLLVSCAKNTVISSEWFNDTKDIVMSFKEFINSPDIETFDDLLTLDNTDINGVKRVNLEWSLLKSGTDVLSGIPVPNGYTISTAFEDSFSISYDHTSNNILPEQDMLIFLKNNFLPSDVEFISHKAWFQKRHKSNGSDRDIGEYIYKSKESGYSYVVQFDYYYRYKNNKTTLDKYYSYVTINKTMD